jgi:hypothetical protein
MSLLKKIYRSLTFRCFTALALGIGIVTFIAVELATLAFDGAMLPETEMAEAVFLDTSFPENEDMLRDMARKMARSHNVDAQLNRIETAAGE